MNQKNPAQRLRVFLLGAGQRPEVRAEAERLQSVLEPLADVVCSDFTGTVDLSNTEADLAIVLGGDGSILRAAHQMQYRQVPVAAVNLGKLGFLANMTPADVPGILRDFAAGQLTVLEHLMFECSVLRDGKTVHRQLGLNETVVQAGSPFRLIDIDLCVDSDLVTTYSCDGLIVATPVGSTAHCLAAGGPILQKSIQAFVVVPLSPHALTMRPVVDSADRVYEMCVARPNPGTSVVVDGRELCGLQPGDRVRVERAAPQFKLVVNPGHTYYRSLREKLGWGGQLKGNKDNS